MKAEATPPKPVDPVHTSQDLPAVESTDLALVFCREDQDKSIRKRTPYYVSPDGNQRIFGVVEAAPIDGKESGMFACRNTSRLHIENLNTGTEQVILQEEPYRWLLGNGLRLADWSADGHYFAFELWKWQYYSDVIQNHMMIYDVEHGVFIHRDHNKALSNFFETKCFADLRLMGFTPDNKGLILKAGKWFRDDSDLYGMFDPCVTKDSLWHLDILKDTIGPLSGNIELVPNGRIVSRREP